jgi:hypothetical protein
MSRRKPTKLGNKILLSDSMGRNRRLEHLLSTLMTDALPHYCPLRQCGPDLEFQRADIDVKKRQNIAERKFHQT